METDNTTNNDFSLEQVQDFIKGQVEVFVKENLEQQGATRQQPQTTSTDEQRLQQQIQQQINPFIQPGIDAAKLTAADAKDYVSFYDSPEKLEEKTEIEQMFKTLLDAGRPIPRSDIYDYLQGKKYRENPETFLKSKGEKRQQQLDRASSAVDIGFSAIDRARNDPKWSNVKSMPLDELTAALDGVTF